MPGIKVPHCLRTMVSKMDWYVGKRRDITEDGWVNV